MLHFFIHLCSVHVQCHADDVRPCVRDGGVGEVEEESKREEEEKE